MPIADLVEKARNRATSDVRPLIQHKGSHFEIMDLQAQKMEAVIATSSASGSASGDTHDTTYPGIQEWLDCAERYVLDTIAPAAGRCSR